MSLHHAQEPMDRGDMEPKHRVFLCHSGTQKGFVEQIDKDLRSVDQNPFFDKDRESLPIGDHFPNLIFKAIERCDVGVVFLSEEFFMRSHWPMFELVKMVDCERRVMPIYLGISPGDLSNEEKVAKWKSKWEAWAKVDWRIDVAKWEKTLRSLRPLNGLVYYDAVGEVKFREEIVKEICKKVPSYYVWDDSHVQGMSRICKVIKEKISETTKSQKGVQVIGLYGVGGIGKTTACKCLCTNLALEFDGRVCCIEFGDGISELDRVREVLKRLTSTNNDFLKEKNMDECWIRLKGQLPLKKVVLAIDNVSGKSETCEEARKYLRLEYGEGNVVMVIARALGELENLGIKSERCLAMPELVREEARALFLYHVGCENEVKEDLVVWCIQRCYFGKGDGSGSKHYHPLTLKALGSQLVGNHPSWLDLQFEEEDVFNQRREEKNPVFSILGRSFDTLVLEDQMLFMDVALFDDVFWDFQTSLWRTGGVEVFVANFGWWTIFEWLSMVHGDSVDRVKKRLNELKRRSLIEELGDGSSRIGMHDLWREFAMMKAKHAEEGNSKWVYEDYVRESCMSSGGWKSLRRIYMMNLKLKSVNFMECSGVRVLRLKGVFVENGVLDLSGLKLIKSLEMDQWRKWRNYVVEYHMVSGIGQLLNLKRLSWLNMKLGNPVEEISCLTNLQVLHLSSIDTQSRFCEYTSSTSLDLQHLWYLSDVRVTLQNLVSISGFSSKMKELRILVLAGCYRLRRCVGVGDVDSLEVLLLNGCNALEELSNLQKLTRLQRLNIDSCGLLEALPGLESLIALQELGARSWFRVVGTMFLHCGVKELPSMSNLTKLEILDLSGCLELKCIPGLGDLVALRVLVVHSGCLQGLVDLGNLQKLQELVVSHRWNDNESELGCQGSQSVVNLAMFIFISRLVIWATDCKLANLCKLITLKSLELHGCKFESLPDMGRDMRLESLHLSSCWRLRGLDGVWGSDFQVDSCCDWTLPNLKELVVDGCDALEVIDLSHFPQLRSLSIRCGELVKAPGFVLQCPTYHLHLEVMKITGTSCEELPDLRKFPSLQCVEIRNCCKLLSLTISRPLTALNRVVLESCWRLHTVPILNLIPRLTYFSNYGCKALRLNHDEVQGLKARGFHVYHHGRASLPSPSESVALLSTMNLNCHANVEVVVDAPNEVDATLEPSTSEFIPYNGFLSMFGSSVVPEQDLELSCSNGSTFVGHTWPANRLGLYCGVPRFHSP